MKDLDSGNNVSGICISPKNWQHLTVTVEMLG